MNETRHDLTVADLLILVWLRKSELIWAIVLGLVIGGGVSLILPKKYESRASFIGVGGSRLTLPASLGSLGALASQFGLAGIGGRRILVTPISMRISSLRIILTQLATCRMGSLMQCKCPTLQIPGRGRTRSDSVQRLCGNPECSWWICSLDRSDRSRSPLVAPIRLQQLTHYSAS